MPQPKENSPIKRDILFRVHLLYAAFVLIAALVFARLIWVQLFSSEVAYNAERLEGRIFTDEIIPARRGNILTRDGEPLATSLFRYQVEMDYGMPRSASARTTAEWVVERKLCSCKRTERSRRSCTSRSRRVYFMSRCSAVNMTKMLTKNVTAI